VLFKQPEKVAIFGHDNCTCITGREKYVVVVRITQPNVAHSLGLNIEILI